MYKRFTFSMLLILLLASCQKITPSPTNTATATVPVVLPTATNTTTPVPPTETATPTSTQTPEPTPTATSTPVVYGPDNFPSDVNPLTGLKVADQKNLERRPIAFKANIIPRSSNRPPWGLSLADLVYDYYHNDGYTRFHAIYLGTDAEEVGPIRSGRFLDHELIRMYKSNFAYGSADYLINQRLFNAEYADRLILEGETSSCPPTSENPLCRYEPNKSDLMVGDTQAITQYINNLGIENGRQDLNGMYFAAVTPTGGKNANQVYVRYSGDNYLRWDYDPGTGQYLRYQDNVYDQGQGEEYAPLIDRVNDQQISASNVVILFVRHEYYRLPPAEIVEILLSGIGTAYAFRDGQVFEVQWDRPTTYSVLSLTWSDGSPFPFKPGNTWFQVIGVSSQITQPEESVWRFQFVFP